MLRTYQIPRLSIREGSVLLKNIRVARLKLHKKKEDRNWREEGQHDAVCRSGWPKSCDDKQHANNEVPSWLSISTHMALVIHKQT